MTSDSSFDCLDCKSDESEMRNRRLFSYIIHVIAVWVAVCVGCCSGCRVQTSDEVLRARVLNLNYPDGKTPLCQMQLVDGQKHGTEMWYNKDGKVVVQGSFRAGRPLAGDFLSVSGDGTIYLLKYQNGVLQKALEADQLQFLVDHFEVEKSRFRKDLEDFELLKTPQEKSSAQQDSDPKVKEPD